jgi:hypothetical protein
MMDGNDDAYFILLYLFFFLLYGCLCWKGIDLERMGYDPLEN